MRFILHALLRGCLSVVGFFSGGVAGALLHNQLFRFLKDFLGFDAQSTAGAVSQMVFAAIFFFGGAILGLKFGNDLVVWAVPVRCRTCGGRAYPYDGEEVGRQEAYRCEGCAHVSLLPFFRK